MEFSAKAKNIRIAPRKVRLVLNNIRQKPVSTAFAVLRNTQRNSSKIIEDLLKSAVANALNQNSSVDVDSLIVTKATADEAPTIKRFRPRAMGRASKIHKRGSHISLKVETTD